VSLFKSGAGSTYFELSMM